MMKNLNKNSNILKEGKLKEDYIVLNNSIDYTITISIKKRWSRLKKNIISNSEGRVG